MPTDGPASGARRSGLPLTGHEVRPVGHLPFPLDRPDRVWVVEEGALELFLSPLDEMGRPGPRHHVCTIHPGGMVFGVDPDWLGWPATLFATPVDARLFEAEKEDFLTLASGGVAGDASRALDGWLSAILEAIPHDAPPGRYRALDEDPLSLAMGDIAFPGDGVRWVRVTAGEARVFGLPEEPIPTDSRQALTSRGWMHAATPGTHVDGIGTEKLLATDTARDALALTHRMAFRLIRRGLQEAAAAEADRLGLQAEADRKGLAGSLSRLAGVLHATPPEGVFAGISRQDPLLAACQVVGRALGVGMVGASGVRYGRRPPDPVSAIATASRVRVRSVLLRDRWWEGDGGPLLGFLGTERHPVALIRGGRGRYEVLDPASASTWPVDEAVAAELNPQAHMFFPPLPPGRLTSRDLLRSAGRGLSDSWRTLLASSLTVALLALVTPLAAKVLFDDVIPGADRPQLLAITLILLLLAAVGAVTELLRGLAILRVEAALELRIEAALMDRLLRLPMGFFKRFTAGDLTSRALGVAQIRRIVTNAAVGGVLGGLFSTVNLVVIFALDPRLGFLALGLGAVAFGAVALSSRYAMQASRAVTAAEGRLSGVLFQFLSGIRKLRVAGVEPRAFGVWARGFADQRSAAYRGGTIQNRFEVFNATFPILSNIAFFGLVFVLAGKAMVAGEEAPVSAGAFVAVIAAFAQFVGGVLGVGLAFLGAVQAVPLWERLRPILSEEPEVRAESRDPGELRGDIEVAHVSFRYGEDGPPVLEDVSLHIRAGEMVALVGPSGSGKSTLYRLLLGLEHPVDGTIYYDGQDLAVLDVDAVRRQIGVVLQNGRLLPGDLLKNIIGSSTNLTLQDAWEAARMAGMAEDIEAMPMGMHTVVSEGAATFSGGQRQRLMIARALVHRPRILLLDEATSALDNRTQQLVTEALDELNVTRIVIAHRLTTVLNADRIFVMDRGRIVEEGTMDELMARNGTFAAMARRQLTE